MSAQTSAHTNPSAPYNPVWSIQKKRDGGELSTEEIQALIRGMMNGSVPEYQIASFLMAVYFRGMSLRETVDLTTAMAQSGKRYDFSRLNQPTVDKHSTGGVGDKVSLILVPLVTACGVAVPMMSGRGLGHTAGTLDKLEAVPGFRILLSEDEIHEQMRTVGSAMFGQSEEVAPADRRLYALRDVTATVESIPLIVASIVSKKIAEGTDALVFDVKVGNGAFMKKLGNAKQLAKMLQAVAKRAGIRTRALLTQMDQPLGYAVGHSLELIESLEILRGQNIMGREYLSTDLRELTVILCAEMLFLARRVRSVQEGRKLAALKLQDGTAYQKFEEIVARQGGNLDFLRSPLRLIESTRTVLFKATRSGFIHTMHTEAIGHALIALGGGRKKTTDSIDHSVGFCFSRKVGAKVTKGDVIATLRVPKNWSESEPRLVEALGLLESAIAIGASRKPAPKLVLGDL